MRRQRLKRDACDNGNHQVIGGESIAYLLGSRSQVLRLDCQEDDVAFGWHETVVAAGTRGRSGGELAAGRFGGVCGDDLIGDG